MGEIIRVGLMTIGAGVVALMAMLAFAVIAAAVGSSRISARQRDLFAEEELRVLREKRRIGSHTPKITKYAGRQVVTPQGRLVTRIAPTDEVLPGDMLDHLKGDKP